jgi:hypothetical protein
MPGGVLVVGREPASDDEEIGLSAPVTAAFDETVRVVLGLVRAARAATGTDAAAAGEWPADPSRAGPPAAAGGRPAIGHDGA